MTDPEATIVIARGPLDLMRELAGLLAGAGIAARLLRPGPDVRQG